MADAIVEIVPHGDVVLAVTKGEQTLRFKVHSIFLRTVSEVFAALLSPKFAEGKALALSAGLSSLCEITLNDDDLESMRLILSIIHHKPVEFPQQLTSKQALDFAGLVDKYLLHNVVPSRSPFQLIPKKEDDLHAPLQAAVLLGHAEPFAEATRLMILHQITSCSAEACAGQDGIFFHTIQKKRNDIRQAMISAFMSIELLPKPNHDCKYLQELVSQLYKNFDVNGSGFARLQNTSVETGFDIMLEMFNFAKFLSAPDICLERTPHTSVARLRETYQTRLRELMKFDGLCLDCEQMEHNGTQRGTCKFRHKIRA